MYSRKISIRTSVFALYPIQTYVFEIFLIRTYIFAALSTSNVRIRALFYSYVRILALRAELLHTPFVSSWIPTRTSCMLSRSLHTPGRVFPSNPVGYQSAEVCLSVCHLKAIKNSSPNLQRLYFSILFVLVFLLFFCFCFFFFSGFVCCGTSRDQFEYGE